MKAIILAAGEGTRMRPLTFETPKCMLPVAEHPVLEWNIKFLKSLQVEDILIVIGYKGEFIQKYFKSGEKFGVHIQYAHQNINKSKGLAAATKLGETFIGGDDFILLLGDNLYVGSYEEVVRHHISTNALATLHIETVENPTRYGVVELADDCRITHLIEKPINPPSNFVITGFYVLNHQIFEAINSIEPSARGELELTDAINYLLKHGEVYGIKTEGWRKDLGYPQDLLHATNWLMRKYNYNTIESAITSDVTVIPPVYIGKNVTIHNSKIGPHATLLSGANISSSEIENTIVFPNANVSNSKLNNSIVAQSVISIL